MARLRIAVRAAAAIFLFLLAVGPHLLCKLVASRSPVPRLFLAAVARIAGARVRVVGAPLRPHSLLIVNHVSWLDILVLGGATDCAFVSKDDLGHGLVHWLADQNRTIYVKREHRKGAKGQAQTIAAALEREHAVALFPEGTVGPGDALLPFRSTLIEAASYAARDVEVRPVALDFGAAATEISWHGETGRDNLLRVLGRPGTIAVAVRLLDPLDRSLDRKQLAAAARDAIAAALAASSPRAPRL